MDSGGVREELWEWRPWGLARRLQGGSVSARGPYFIGIWSGQQLQGTGSINLSPPGHLRLSLSTYSNKKTSIGQTWKQPGEGASRHNSLVCRAAKSENVNWDPMDWSPPGSSIHGILQARILKWVAIPFSRGSSQPRDWTQVSCIVGRFFSIWTARS